MASLRRLVCGAALGWLAAALLASGCAPATAGRPAAAAGQRAAMEVAASSGGASSPAGSVAPPAAEASALDLLPELYGLLRLPARVHGSAVRFMAPFSCATVLDLLGAGEWRLDVFAKPAPGLHIYGLSLTLGDRIAVGMLQDGAAACSGTLTTETEHAVTVTGATSASGVAKQLPFYCHVGPDPNSNDPKALVLSYFALLRTSTAAYILITQGPATKGTHQLVASDDADGVTVLTLKDGRSALATVTRFLKGVDGSGQASFEDAMSIGVTGGYGGDATLRVTSAEPFAATVTAPELADLEHEGARPIAITAALSCDT